MEGKNKEDKLKRHWQIFISTFYISAFSFGGGFAIIPLLQKKFVDDLGWLEENEVLDLSALAQSAPGAIAVNAAMLLGYQVEGVVGALVAMVGTVLPPLIIISIISAFYDAFRANKVISAILFAMAAAVTAVVADVVITMITQLVQSKKVITMLLFVGAVIANMVFKVNILFIILFCGTTGAALGYYGHKRGKGLL